MYRILDKRNRPLEFINPKGKDHLKNVYRFNVKNPIIFKTMDEAQDYLADKLEECRQTDYPRHLWRSIKSIHWSLRIVASDEPIIVHPMTPKVFIEVRGGTVQAVWGVPDTEYVLIDWDEQDEDAETRNNYLQSMLVTADESGEVEQLNEVELFDPRI